MIKNIKKIVVLIFALVLVSPIAKVYAYQDNEVNILPIELVSSDFDEAVAQEGHTTDKGINYHDEDFYMSPGNYQFAENIYIGNEWTTYMVFEEGSSTLDLNGHNTDLSLNVYPSATSEGAYLEISGNGIVTKGVSVEHGGSTTIKGGTYKECLFVGYDASLTIDNATVEIASSGSFEEINPAIYATEGAVLTINNGTFTSETANVVELDSSEDKGPSSVVINGGIFIGGQTAINASVVDSLTINNGSFVGTNAVGIDVYECGSLVINGGEVSGGITGLSVEEHTKSISLAGGKFTVLEGYDRTIKSAILYVSSNANAYSTIFMNMLAENHIYDKSITTSNYTIDGLVKYEIAYTNQEELIVIEDQQGDNTVEYNLTSTNGKAQAIFRFSPGHNFTFTFEDLLEYTPEQIEEEYNYPAEEYKKALENVKKNTSKYGELLALYGIEITETQNFGYSDALKLRIKMNELLKKYSKFKLLYLNERNNMSVEEEVDMEAVGDYAEGNLNHLSAYALVGVEKTSNPPTGDNIVLYLITLGLCTIIIFVSGMYIKNLFI